MFHSSVFSVPLQLCKTASCGCTCAHLFLFFLWLINFCSSCHTSQAFRCNLDTCIVSIATAAAVLLPFVLSTLAVRSVLWSSPTRWPCDSRVQPCKEQSCVDWLASSALLPHLLHFVILMFLCLLSKCYKCHCFIEPVTGPEVLLF